MNEDDNKREMYADRGGDPAYIVPISAGGKSGGNLAGGRERLRKVERICSGDLRDR